MSEYLKLHSKHKLKRKLKEWYTQSCCADKRLTKSLKNAENCCEINHKIISFK